MDDDLSIRTDAGRNHRHRRRRRRDRHLQRRRPPPAVTDAAEGCDRVRLDLTAVEFIDSTGLGCLLELRSTLRAREVVLEIAVGDGPVRQAVEITGLGELLAR